MLFPRLPNPSMRRELSRQACMPAAAASRISPLRTPASGPGRKATSPGSECSSQARHYCIEFRSSSIFIRWRSRMRRRPISIPSWSATATPSSSWRGPRKWSTLRSPLAKLISLWERATLFPCVTGHRRHTRLCARAVNPAPPSLPAARTTSFMPSSTSSSTITRLSSRQSKVRLMRSKMGCFGRRCIRTKSIASTCFGASCCACERRWSPSSTS